MNPDIEQIKRQLENVEAFMERLRSASTIDFDVYTAFRDRFQLLKFAILDASVAQGLSNAPLTTISDPSGGATVDSQARVAIGSLIDRLQSLGLIT